MDKISIIVPCYNEEESLPLFYREVCKVMEQIPETEVEFVFVDDGSRDHTLRVLRKLAEDPRCNYFSFSRNFGKEAAMYAGLRHATGDYCVIMDADLQHPPSLLKEMYHAVSQEGFDCCAGFREDREGEGKLRNFLSRGFYKVIQRMCSLDMTDGTGDFRMMSRQVVNSILKMKEYNRYMKGIFSFVGFETKLIPFHNVERAAGTTKWNLKSLFRYAMDGIFSFSTAPAAWAGVLGILLLFVAFLVLAVSLFQTLFSQAIGMWPWVIALILGLSGIQMCFIGMLGQYAAKGYMETKNRPVYIIKDSSQRKRRS